MKFKINRRRRSKGTYLSSAELKEALQDAYRIALSRAAMEAFEGRYSREELAKMVNYDRLIADALSLILEKRSLSGRSSRSKYFRNLKY